MRINKIKRIGASQNHSQIEFMKILNEIRIYSLRFDITYDDQLGITCDYLHQLEMLGRIQNSNYYLKIIEKHFNNTSEVVEFLLEDKTIG